MHPVQVDLLINTVGVLHDKKNDEQGRMPERQIAEITEDWFLHNVKVLPLPLPLPLPLLAHRATGQYSGADMAAQALPEDAENEAGSPSLS
eukprot:676216-Hanusia_phi.AAC.2